MSAPDPMNLLGLLNNELDTNETAALRAAHRIQSMTRHFLGWMSTLETATDLLKESAETSGRARAAYERFSHAVDQANTIVSDLSDAQDALATGWPAQS